MLWAAAFVPLWGQSVSDPIDDPIDCSTGRAISGLLPAVIDIISIDIRKQNEDLLATVEFRGDPSIGDSVSGGILAVDPQGLPSGSGSDWHFDNAGNVMFAYAGDALATASTKFVADSMGAWVADSTTGFNATRAGNVVVVRIPGSELGSGSLWMTFASSRLFEITPRCDVAGNDSRGLPILEVPQLVTFPDSFAAIGNVGITVPASAGLLSNDVDAQSITDFDTESDAGGAVAVKPDGAFTFEPAAGFSGQDRFTYTVTDGKGGVSTADVLIDVGRGLWFVDASSEADPGSGTRTDPFRDLVALMEVKGTPSGPKPGDAILLFEGAYGGGIELDSGQVVVGQSLDMFQTLQDEGFLFPLYSDLPADPPSIGGSPVLASDSSDAILLAEDNRVYGVSIHDTPMGAAFRGDSVGTLMIRHVDVQGRGAVIDVGEGDIDIVLDVASSDSALLDAISLRNVDGSFSVSAPVLISAPGRHGFAVSRGALVTDLPGLTVLAADSGTAVTVTIAGGQTVLGQTELRSVSGAGLHVTGGSLAIDGGVIETGDSAIALVSTQVDVLLDSVTSAGSGGWVLNDVSGSLVVAEHARIQSAGSPAIDVGASSLVFRLRELFALVADSAAAIRISDSEGTRLRIVNLELTNSSGAGVSVHRVDSVRIDAGSIATNGGAALDLSDLAAEIDIDSVAVDSADAGIRLTNVGGVFRLATEDPDGRTGHLRRISGKAIEATNVASLVLRQLDIAETGGSAIDLRNFGDVALEGLDITTVDSTAIRAWVGGKLDVSGASISDVWRGIEAHEVDHVRLDDNSIVNTVSVAVTVSNTAPVEPANASLGKSFAGDVLAEIIGNDVSTSAAQGVQISAGEVGSLVLDLRMNQTASGVDDYVLSVSDPAILMLSGYAGGDSDALTSFIRNTNVGSPRVNVTGTVSPGPSGQADVVAVEKAVSDLQPLPERVIEYTMTATNLGPAPAIGVVLVDSLPETLAYVSGSIRLDGDAMTDADDDDAADFGSTNEGTLTVRLGDLSVTDTVVVSFQARPRQASAGTSVLNTVLVESVSPDAVAVNNMAEVEISVMLNTSTEDEGVPREFALGGNYPNPFNPATTIVFDLPSREHVHLTVLNVLGQPIAELFSGDLNPGRHEVKWNGLTDGGTRAGSGLYIYSLQAGRLTATRSMILLK